MWNLLFVLVVSVVVACGLYALLFWIQSKIDRNLFGPVKTQLSDRSVEREGARRVRSEKEGVSRLVSGIAERYLKKGVGTTTEYWIDYLQARKRYEDRVNALQNQIQELLRQHESELSDVKQELNAVQRRLRILSEKYELNKSDQEEGSRSEPEPTYRLMKKVKLGVQ
jgi:hypothetical protein